MSRELTADVADFSQEELDSMASNGVTPEEVREFIRTSAPQNLDVAIGGILAIRSGQGQERNEPFKPADDAVGEYHVAGELAPVAEGVTKDVEAAVDVEGEGVLLDSQIAQAEDLISPPATET